MSAGFVASMKAIGINMTMNEFRTRGLGLAIQEIIGNLMLRPENGFAKFL